MMRLSEEGAGPAEPNAQSANLGFVSDESNSAAPPATAMLISVTAASRTILQFSSGILMAEKRGKRRTVPAAKPATVVSGSRDVDAPPPAR
jgi:hypothetical protein